MSFTILAHRVNTRNAPKYETEPRQARAREIVAAGAVQPVADDSVVFACLVQSQSRPGVCYPVRLGLESCGCQDWQRHHLPCKHVLAARAYYLAHWQDGAQ